MNLSSFLKILPHILLFSIVIIKITNAYKCVHNEIAKDFAPQFLDPPLEEATPNYLLDQTAYSPIRIYVDYSNLNSAIDPSVVSFIKNHIIPATVNYFQSVLRVVRFSSNLTLKANSYCFRAPITQNISVAADLILFVTATPTDEDYLAWASACYLDVKTHRPVAGQININPNKTSQKYSDFLNQLRTFIHETTHILGFSSSLYSLYVDPTTNLPLGLSQVFQNKTINGVYTPFIILPQVINVAKKYFLCDNVTGVQLENQGTSASLGSHWERRILGDELMTSTSKYDSKMSEFTLALLEGTGWYVVDYTKTEYLLWGRRRGCAFLNESCITSNHTARFPEFCDRLNGSYCTLGNLFRGVCAVRAGTTISSWNYFGNNTIALDAFDDNCPYPIYYSNGDCRKNGSQALFIDQVYGDHSRCFEGTLIKQAYKASEAINTFCLSYSCQVLDWANSYKLNIQIGNITVSCQSGGERLAVAGYTGYLNCPDPVEFCNHTVRKYCPLGCGGRGECQNGECVCQEGWDKSYACALGLNQSTCAKCHGKPCFGDVCVSALKISAVSGLLGILWLILYLI